MNQLELHEKTLAADAGDSQAQLELAFHYARNPQSTDYAKAIFYYERAAQAGLPVAQHNLACMHLNGEGCKRDLGLAKHWFEEAARQGDVDAQFNLGLMYTEGKYFPQDDREAFKWFEQAARNGSARGQYDLGLIYEHGRGVPKDIQLAAHWFAKSAAQGVARAHQKLAAIKAAPPADCSDQPSKFTEPELYYQTVQSRPAHKTLEVALTLFEREGVTAGMAIDLGSGSGRDTISLLKRGWRVTAIDNEPKSFEYLTTQAEPDLFNQLSTVISRMENAEFPSSDLVNASLSLPFCQPLHFPHVWQRITQSIKPRGRFAGHFFGDRDTWAEDPMQTHHSRSSVLELFNDFEIEHFEEIEDDNPSVQGESKHWHIFHVVARKVQQMATDDNN